MFAEWGGIRQIKAVHGSTSTVAQPQQSISPTIAKTNSLPSPSASQRNKNANASDDIEWRVRTLIVEQLNVKPEQIVPSANIRTDFGADPLDLVELVMAAEEEFKIEIPDDDVERIQTVADACEYIRKHIKKD